MKIALTNCNLDSMEKALCEAALEQAGGAAGAAELLGIDQRELSRVIVKHRVCWPRERVMPSYKPEPAKS